MDDNESILLSIKKLLGIDKENTDFDLDITMHINSVFLVLSQLGIGPSTGYSISGSESIWTEFIPDNDLLLNYVKTYIYLSVRLAFDPPSSSVAVQSMKDMIAEHEWRLIHENEKNVES